MQKLLTILGPTSVGKTGLALRLAKKFNGELVACDSRQVYKKLDIGTGKMPDVDVSCQSSAIRRKKGNGFWEIEGIKIWMYDVADPKRQYTVYDFVKDASKVISGVERRDKLPIIVGGTGLYLKAILSGLPNLAIPLDLDLRKKLEKLSLKKLQEKLQKISPKKWEKMNNSDRQNPRRLIRAIEIASTDFTSEESLRATVRGGFNTLKIGLTAPRESLYQRIDERVVSRIDQGMVDEAKSLHKSGLSFKRMRQLGLEYGVLANYLEGKITSEQELVKILQGKIHGYARRQITWFKKEKNILWFDITDQNFPANVEKEAAKWYYQVDAAKG